MIQPLYLLPLFAWAIMLIVGLRRYCFQAGVGWRWTLALALTVAIVGLCCRLSVQMPDAHDAAFASVEQIRRDVENWRWRYLLDQGWPGLAAGYFLFCSLIAWCWRRRGTRD
ncbi:hypothetical protein [Lysobacter sp. CA199]|uniref:hypothetical protein n=1 Tax=Lysobacter sp. CA199 TaxID=3455608 RepID=UPI003F8D0A44